MPIKPAHKKKYQRTDDHAMRILIVLKARKAIGESGDEKCEQDTHDEYDPLAWDVRYPPVMNRREASADQGRSRSG